MKATFPPNFVWNNYTAGKWEQKETFCQNSLMHLFNGDRPIVHWLFLSTQCIYGIAWYTLLLYGIALHCIDTIEMILTDWRIAYCTALLLALVLVELQNTCKKKLNRKMLERPNICYIFGKLGVQGCQIWHSHVSIPFNSAPAHSTRPHNAKKALYVIISGEIPEN